MTICPISIVNLVQVPSCLCSARKPWAVVIRGSQRVGWPQKIQVSTLPTLQVCPSFLPTCSSKSSWFFSLINHAHPSQANSPTPSFSFFCLLCTGSTTIQNLRLRTHSLSSFDDTYFVLIVPCYWEVARCHIPDNSSGTTPHILQSSSGGNNKQ